MKSELFQAVILAGGLATRLRPLTDTVAKSLIPVNGEPFIAHQLRLLKRQGIRDVVICVGFLGNQIKEVVGDGNEFGLNIIYSFDGPRLLGTAGAIKQAMCWLDDAFFVIYGDSYLSCDYQAVQHTFIKSEKLALMTVFRNNGMWDTSNVEFLNNEIRVYDKKNKSAFMQYIDYGLGLFKKEAFDQVPNNEPYDLSLLYQKLLACRQLSAFEVSKRFYEIGSFAGIKELEYHLLSDYLTHS